MPDRTPAPDRRLGARTTKHRGRLSTATRTALDELSGRWGVAAAGPWTSAGLDATFGRHARRLLDVGVGTGGATLDWAVRHPDHDVVAVELHRPGIGRLLRALEDGAAPNVRVAQADVTRLVEAGIEAGSFAEVRILFPDPWPKRKHRWRRLVDEEFVGAMTDLVGPGGRLHLATDWDDYADQMRAALAADRRLRPQAEGWASTRPERPVTDYERRGLAAGRRITDLVAVRRD